MENYIQGFVHVSQGLHKLGAPKFSLLKHRNLEHKSWFVSENSTDNDSSCTCTSITRGKPNIQDYTVALQYRQKYTHHDCHFSSCSSSPMAHRFVCSVLTCDVDVHVHCSTTLCSFHTVYHTPYTRICTKVDKKSLLVLSFEVLNSLKFQMLFIYMTEGSSVHSHVIRGIHTGA